ncbi:hypothetical protein [Shimia sp.]|uniref:hypothetical protein n=1 Tax=Shimia sp. TaxID=1954381 RepID=UPI003B8BD7F0
MFEIGVDPFSDLREFINQYSQALYSIAFLRAGKSGVDALNALSDELKRQPRMTRRIREQLAYIRRLLDLSSQISKDTEATGALQVIELEGSYSAEISLLLERLDSIITEQPEKACTYAE